LFRITSLIVYMWFICICANTDSTFHLSLHDALPLSRIADAAGTTAVLASAATLGSLVLGLPATWALFRRSWRGARLAVAAVTVRSEEHTSELQSRENIVCRLLLEKKINLHRAIVQLL